MGTQAKLLRNETQEGETDQQKGDNQKLGEELAGHYGAVLLATMTLRRSTILLFVRIAH